MGDFADSVPDSEYLTIGPLAPETARALEASAQHNGRSVEKEAEHIIKTHIQTSLAKAE